MSSSTAEMSVVLRAQNLAGGAITGFKNDLDSIATKATSVVSRFKSAFVGIGNVVGNIAGDVVAGREPIEQGFAQLGVFAAASMAAAFGEQLLAKIAGSALVAQLAAGATALGTAIGTLIDTGIAIGMAAAPFVIIAALGAIFIAILANPDLVRHVEDVAAHIIQTLAAKLFELGGKVVDAIIRALGGLADRMRAAIRAAIHAILPINIGPIHITESGISIDPLTPPKISKSQSQYGNYGPQPHAMGGWVGLNGPEIALVGERGPEYVTKHNETFGGGRDSGFTIQGVSEREIVDMVDRGLYFKLRRQAPTVLRS